MVWAIVIIVVGILVLYPTFWLLYGSITTKGNVLTFKNYIKMFTTGGVLDSLGVTVVTALASTILSVVVAVPMAWLVARTDMPYKQILTNFIYFAYITPPFLKGFAFILLFGPRAGIINKWLTAAGLPILNIFSMTGLVFSLFMHLFVYVFMTTSTALRTLDPEVEDAARISGASPLKTTLFITLPMVSPAITSGALISFVIGLNLFSLHAMIGMPAKIRLLTTEIYTFFSYPVRFSQAASWSVMLFVVAGIAMYINTAYLGRKQFITVKGRGMRPDIVRLGRWRYVGVAYCSLVVLITLGLPVITLVVASFIRSWGAGVSLGNISLKHYKFILTEFSLTKISLLNSFFLAVTAATCIVVLATVMSYIIIRSQVRGKKILDYLSMIPMTIPGIVLAVGLIWAYIRPPLLLYGTYTIMLVAYVTKFYPIALKMTSSSLMQIEPELEDCVRIHGGSWFDSFLRVTVPLIKAGLIASWVMTFVLSLRELSASIILYSPGKQVAAVAFLQLWEEGLFEPLSAFSVILLIIVVISYSLVRRLGGRTVFEM